MNNNGVNCDNIDLTAKSKSELAEEYGVSGRTFASWIRGKGLMTGRRQLLTSAEVRFVYNNLGIPRKNVPIKSVMR